MCGICGILLADSSKPVDPDALSRMNRALTHRGPDEEGDWVDGHVGLAARRLRVLDLEGGRQPMVSDDGALAVAFNGEIYNFREVRRTLEGRGYRFKTRCDTEVVLNAIHAYGEDAVHRFNGMFAIAAYWPKDNRLLLARDRLGIKPLSYSFQNGAFVFSSELDSLMRSGHVNGGFNAAAIDAYFTYLYIPAPDTVYENVWKVRPGELVTFDGASVVTRSYWRPEFHLNESWTLPEAAEIYRDHLQRAVDLQRVSDVPLGAFLSGGMDSSSVVAALSGMSGQPVRTFSIGFDDAEANELPYARTVAERYGTEHTEEVLHPDFASISSELVRHFGEPFADSSAIPTWLVSRLARNELTVALSGDGGDELFAGYTWAHMNRRVARYRRVPGVLRAIVDTALKVPPDHPGINKLRRFSGDSFLSPTESFRRRHTCFTADQKASLYRGTFREAIGAEALDRFQEHADFRDAPSDDDWMLEQDLRMYLPDDVLTKVDRMSMAHSLEVRVPLLDHQLVEFALTVPFRLKHAGGTSKLVAKEAVKDLLPEEVLAQRKRGFSLPIHRWFREGLKKEFEAAFFDGAALSSMFLERDAIRALYERHQSDAENLGHHLWCLLQFEHWLQYAAEFGGGGN